MNLIIINGACGVGKSTIAALLHESIKLSYLIDVDDIRRNVSQYREYKKESNKISQEVTQSIIKTILPTQDVIIDKMMHDPKIIDSYYDIAKECKAKVIEIILWAPKEVVMKRADDRGYRKEGLLTRDKCNKFWDQIDELKKTRKNAIIIDTSKFNEKEVLKKIKLIINT